MKNTYSPEIRQRAVRLYQEQRSEYPTQWAATVSIASKFGCTPEMTIALLNLRAQVTQVLF